MRERDVERYLAERVDALGGETRKVGWHGRRGAPDRYVMLPGGIGVWVELKAPGAPTQGHQTREHERMRALGQHVVVLDSVQAVDAFLA